MVCDIAVSTYILSQFSKVALLTLTVSGYSKEIEQDLDGDLVHINTYITAEMNEDQIYNIALNDIGGETSH